MLHTEQCKGQETCSLLISEACNLLERLVVVSCDLTLAASSSGSPLLPPAPGVFAEGPCAPTAAAAGDNALGSCSTLLWVAEPC